MRFLPVLLLALLPALPVRASAIYTYRERDGTIVYTNVPPAGVKARRLGGSSFRQAPRPAEPPARSVIAPSLYLAWMQEAARSTTSRWRWCVRWPTRRATSIPTRSRGRAPRPDAADARDGLDMYVRDIFDARQNIFGGVRYLRVLANEFDGQMETIVAAYNAGPDAVRKYGNQVPRSRRPRSTSRRSWRCTSSTSRRGQ
jgi:hypothetical protein